MNDSRHREECSAPRPMVAVALLCMAFGAPGWASSEQADTILSEIIVTGSRTASSVEQSTIPVQVLDQADLLRTGVDELGKILQMLPMNTGAPINSNINNSGDGSTRVDLRAVGPARTLILLNGRRIMNGGLGGDESVDLTSLPLSWIESVDVVTSGASAIYGADAVSGVINVITKKNVEGFDVAGSYTSSERGDGQIATVTAGGGFVRDRTSLQIGGEFVKQEGVTLDQRAYSAIPLAYAGSDGSKEFLGSGTVPAGQFGIPAGNALGLAPGNYMRVPGSTGQTAADYMPYTKADAFNYAPYNYSQTPQERDSVWLLGSQRVAEHSELFVEGLVNRRQSAQRLAPSPYSTGSTAAPVLSNGDVGIPANNYYNPFGTDLEDVRRRFTESPDRGYDQTVDTWRGVLGLRGDVASWRWEVSVQASRATTVEHELGRLVAARYANAFGPSGLDASGTVVCGVSDPTTGVVPAANIIAGCVPTNLFGGVGSVTPAQLAYLTPELNNHGVNEEQIVDANLSGRLGRLPSGAINWAAGAQYRRESGSNHQDTLALSGVSDDVETEVPNGSFSVKEIYGEARIPLVRAQPGTSELSADLGVRHSDFSTFGANTTWQAGLLWKPVSTVTARADYARVYRVPSISDLYQTAGVLSATFDRDPCGNSPTPKQRIVCAANGVPGGSYVEADDDEYASIQGGNVGLRPERGFNIGAALEYQPDWASGLRGTIDYYRIALNGAIEAPFAGDVLNACVETGAAGVCDLIQRHPDGSLLQVNTLERNFGNLTTDGMDAGLHWKPSGQQFSAGITGTYLAQYNVLYFPGGPVFKEAGSLSLPHWRALGHVDWNRGEWNASYSLQYIGGYRDCSTFDDGSYYCNKVRGIAYHDVALGYRLPDGIDLRLAVTNLLNIDPPFINFGTNANTDGATYRLLGRSYFLGLRYRTR